MKDEIRWIISALIFVVFILVVFLLTASSFITVLHITDLESDVERLSLEADHCGCHLDAQEVEQGESLKEGCL